MDSATLPDWTIRSGIFTARGSRRGGILNSWCIREGQASLHLIDGYSSVDHMNTLDGCRSAVLAPWSNRIHNAKYVFGGVEYDLGPDHKGVREALHGLAYLRDWEIVDSTDSEVSLAITVGGVPGYPFRVALLLTYVLDGPQLRMRLEATNEGESVAPVALGWHPYFAHNGQWSVSIPASQKVMVDDSLIPLAEPFVEVSNPVVLDTASDVDTAFTALSGDTVQINNGSHVLSMKYIGLQAGAGVGVFHVYTGEGLEQRTGRCVAVEPCEFMPDAFNRPECADYLGLRPGDTRRFEVILEVKQ